ncbi:MAG: hypothetical protein MUF15_12390 [Acidobacteria bacterium]|jgi:hypothetical protein|nr:hypothetical protein [Acidobacteriota bacterium]
MKIFIDENMPYRQLDFNFGSEHQVVWAKDDPDKNGAKDDILLAKLENHKFDIIIAHDKTFFEDLAFENKTHLLEGFSTFIIKPTEKTKTISPEYLQPYVDEIREKIIQGDFEKNALYYCQEVSMTRYEIEELMKHNFQGKEHLEKVMASIGKEEKVYNRTYYESFTEMIELNNREYDANRESQLEKEKLPELEKELDNSKDNYEYEY